MKKRVGIIGGGLGGLAAAITLANRGFDVTVFEKNEHLGGKLMRVQLGDALFDFGPNTITMPHVFNEVIEQTGENPQDYFQFKRLVRHTKNYFPDGKVFEFSSDKAYMLEQLKELDSYGYMHYEAFSKEIHRLYELSEKYFFPRLFKSWRDYVSPSLGTAFMQVHPFTTMDTFFRKYFKNENIIQALNRYATYIGSSPYLTPATFAMIAHLEFNQGVYYVEGGNAKIAEAFVQVGKKVGVTYVTNTEVNDIRIHNKRATTVVTSRGNYECDEVVMNGDLLTQYPTLIEEKHRPSFKNDYIASYEPSISAFVIMVETNCRFKELAHHTVYFSNDYQQEFQDLFTHHTYSKNPTIYISNSSYSDKNQSPHGDNLFILVNVPALQQDGTLQVEKEEYATFILNELDKKIGLKAHIVNQKIIAPDDIATMFHAYRGALYGIAANKKLNAFLRPYNISKDIENLAFVGGSTHPGGGSPMVTLSGLNVGKYLVGK